MYFFHDPDTYILAITKHFILETENRTLIEIEDHFAGRKKLPKRLVTKQSTEPEAFPKDFNVKTWESNNKFEKYLEMAKNQKQINHTTAEKDSIDTRL